MGQSHTFTLNPLPEQVHVDLQLANGGESRTGPVRLRPLAALLRLADVLDNNKVRAGNWHFRKAIEDARRLEIEAELLFLQAHGVSLDGFRGDLLTVEAAPKARLEEIADELKKEGDGCDDLAVKRSLHYLAYLARQPLHFRKHLCFEDVAIECRKQNDCCMLVARYRRAQEAVDYNQVQEALETVRTDLEDEFARIRAIDPFARIHEIQVEVA
jgi:hypothetical protein